MDTSALVAPPRATFYQLQAANRRNSILLVLVFVALVGALGLGLDVFFLGYDPSGQRGLPFPIATFGGIVFGALYAMQGWYFGASQVLGASSARPANPANPAEKQYLNVVEEMAIAAGMPPPTAYVVPDPDPNAFAVGRDPAHASIAVTEGLLATLDREELQGVIGHEMSHVKNLDIRAMTLVTALFGAATLLADVARRGLYWGGGGRSSRRDSRDSGGSGGAIMLVLFVLWILLAILAPLLGQLLVFAVSRSREYLADASGAELTRNPLGLASALRKIASAHEPTRLINQGSAHLCITDPRGMKLNDQEGGMANLFGTHPPIGKRIQVLESMAGVVGDSAPIQG
ncbi:MAG: M48 family metallopeptidase [Candidatus Eisenbacteria bacterium]